MRDRRPRAPVSRGVGIPVAACGIAAAVLLLLLTVAAAGCGSPSSTAAVSCGIARTAANVPVHIQVVRGQVSCTTALQVERDYAADILAGKVPGTGGGAPVRVQGWTCQGFSTPVVLKTGQTSRCVEGGTEILAILPSPT
jgi:hypothetical protein